MAPTNHQQHLFYAWRDRLVAALMHEHVIVPEGASDSAWLEALETAIELRQDWESVTSEPTRFGTFVGVAPTHDAKIAETYTIARAVHSRISCLVDGDGEGLNYLAEVRGLPSPPAVLFVWPTDWAMEHVIAWIAAADSAQSLPLLQAALDIPFPDTAALAAFLLQHKSYAPVHMAVAEILAGVVACRVRAVELLNDIADVARQAPGPRTHLSMWAAQSTPQTKVWRLKA